MSDKGEWKEKNDMLHDSVRSALGRGKSLPSAILYGILRGEAEGFVEPVTRSQGHE
jgi:hypothetical protein